VKSDPLKAKKMSNWLLESPMLSPSRCNSVLADVEKKIQMTMTSSFSIAQIPQFPQGEIKSTGDTVVVSLLSIPTECTLSDLLC
jgi:hypothetical protein